MYTIYADDALLYSPGDEELSVLSPVLETQCNAAGTLTFVLLPEHPMYSALHKMRTRIDIRQDDEIIWRGRVLETETDFYRQKTVTCEGELTYLVDSVLHPYKLADYDGTAAGLFRLYLTRHNEAVSEAQQFQIGNVDIETLSSVENTGYGNTWDEISDNLIDIHGGFLRVRYDGETRYLDWTKESGTSCGQVIRFGENLLDLSEYVSASEVVTCLIPYAGQGDSQITIKSVNDGKDYIEDEAGIALYGRIWGVTEFDAKDASTLLEMAKENLQKRLKETITITISAVDLHLLDVNAESFRVGDKVRVVSPPHGIDAEYTCTAISLDLVSPDQSEYTFGTPETGMASTTAATSKAVEVVDTSVEYLRQIVSDQNTHLLLFDGVIDAYTTKVDDNTKAINTVQLTLNSVTGELTSKVSKDDLVSTINQTAGAVKISANCIDLEGYVTATELSAMKADVSWLNGVSLSVAELTARSGAHLGTADADSLGVSGALSANTISANAIGTTLALTVGGVSAAPRTLKIGESSCTFFAPEDATFELSDMPGYDDALAAAKSEGASSVHVQALEIAGQNYHSSSKYIEVNLDTTLSNGSTEEGLLSVNASSAYNAGASDVAISEITCVDISAGADTGRVRVVVKLSNGKTRQQVFTLS
uniref:Tail protein n=1 Tax=Siphoviridae sp. ctHAs12 TaxID=2827826 RepID=A0A8S5SIK5_9CAUD|nr:MAG TPA: tail protein [Siphoviridae sp. ctHAs12]